MGNQDTRPRWRSAMSRRTAVIVAVAVAVAVVGAVTAVLIVGRGSAPSDRSQTQTVPGGRAPLTGLEDPSGMAGRRCAVTVKIGNTPEARPQYAVESADAVYEEEVEGGITRLAAVFQSQAPDRAGPVRSVRSIDQSIVWPLRGIFAYSGGNPSEVSSLAHAPVTPIDESAAGSMMFRDPERNAPHNLYARVDQLYGRCTDPPPPALFTYRTAAEPSSGDAASSVRVGFQAGYAVTWKWDPGSSTWKRSIFGGPDLGATGEQFAVANVVVMQLHYASDPGSAAAQAVMTGRGPASVFTGGKIIQGTWVRPDLAGPAQLLDRLQQPIPLTPGQTWVELPDVGRTVTTTP